MRAARKREVPRTIFSGRVRRRTSAPDGTFVTQRDTLELVHFCGRTIFARLFSERREVARGAATPPSLLGTGRFAANLFREVNHATLIFTQLCSPAQGAPRGRFNFRPNLSAESP